ncbi:MAG TPA: hypothetical protein PLF78_05285 [Caulobacter sp.]|nr:hypothetical protein [Caulobacter sp.]
MIKKVALSLALASSLSVGGMAHAQEEPLLFGLGTEAFFVTAFVIGGAVIVFDRVDSRDNPASP